MNKLISFRASVVMILILAGFALTSCNKNGNIQTSERSQAPQPVNSPAQPSDGVRRVTILELKDALEKGEAVVVDVRDEVEYKLGHIKDARSLSLGLIAKRSGELPRDKLIVTYCA